MPRTAHFVPEYAAMKGSPVMPAVELTLTTALPEVRSGKLGDGDHHGTLVDAVKEIDVVQRKLVHGATTVDPPVVHDHRTRAVEPRALIRAARSISPHERVGSGPDVDRQPGGGDSAPGAPAGSHQEAATHLAQQRQVAGSPGRMPLWASSAAEKYESRTSPVRSVMACRSRLSSATMASARRSCQTTTSDNSSPVTSSHTSTDSPWFASED